MPIHWPRFPAAPDHCVPFAVVASYVVIGTAWIGLADSSVTGALQRLGLSVGMAQMVRAAAYIAVHAAIIFVLTAGWYRLARRSLRLLRRALERWRSLKRSADGPFPSRGRSTPTESTTPEPRVDRPGALADIDAAMAKGLVRDEFFLLYQPVLDLGSRTVTHAEALLRWRNSELGLVTPDRFIPAAERSGFIVPLGAWVAATACREARDWWRDGLPVSVSINVSPRQFADFRLVDHLAQLLTRTGLPPRRIELEVTETMLIADSPRAADVLAAVSELGVRLSLDDFGTGYSSLSYLKRFRFDTLKIDRCFVTGIASVASDRALIRAIISMAHGLGLRIVAEGVETAEQLAFLEEERCDAIQGFWFSRPLPAETARTFMAARAPEVSPLPGPSTPACVPRLSQLS